MANDQPELSEREPVASVTEPKGPDRHIRLRLMAIDEDDLSVISACLQDALIPLNEIAFLHGENRFMGAFSRFRRECLADPEGCDGLTRCCSVLVFEQVRAVRHRGLDPRLARVHLELLAIQSDRHQGCVLITLTFAGGVEIQLEADTITARLEDFGDPMPASSVPVHPIVTDGSAPGPS